MSRQHHYLVMETEFYQAVEKGTKKFVISKDKDFRVYDMVHLQEVVNEIPTGRVLQPLEITYVLNGGKYGLEEGCCIFNWR